MHGKCNDVFGKCELITCNTNTDTHFKDFGMFCEQYQLR